MVKAKNELEICRKVWWKRITFDWNFFALCTFLLLFVLIVACNLIPKQTNQHYLWLAQAFTHGRLDFIGQKGVVGDWVEYGGKYFWPLGPLPAVMLVPLVWSFARIGVVANQGVLAVVLIGLTGLLVYRLAKKSGYIKPDSYWWIAAFVLGTMFLGVACIPSSWYLAHLVTVVLAFGLLLELNLKPRFWLVGILVAGLLATRFTAGLAGLVFATGWLIRHFWNKNGKFGQVVGFGLPIVGIIALLGWYNFARFGDIFNFGYAGQYLVIDKIAKAREYGLFSLAHLPGNIYYSLLAGPVPVLRDGVSLVLKFPYVMPNYDGIGLFYTSPYLLYLFGFKYRDWLAKITAVTVLPVIFLIYCYYGVGYAQVGYRYFLDIMPFVFYLFIVKYREKYGSLTPVTKVYIFLGIVFNVYILMSRILV